MNPTDNLFDLLNDAAQKAQYIVDNHDSLKKPGNELQKIAIEIRDLCDTAIKHVKDTV